MQPSSVRVTIILSVVLTIYYVGNVNKRLVEYNNNIALSLQKYCARDSGERDHFDMRGISDMPLFSNACARRTNNFMIVSLCHFA